MLVLHAAGSDGSLLLWAETELDASRTRSREGRHRRSRAHPFAATAADLAAAVARAAPTAALSATDAGRARAWLPTRGSWPQSSTGMLGDPPPSRARVRIAPWSVDVLRVPAGEAVGLLLAAAGRERPLAPGVVSGCDLRYWADALGLAVAIVAAGQFLPAIRTVPAGAQATWDPVYWGPGAERFAGLASRMPASARALSGPRAWVAPASPPADLLRGMVARLTDHLVRSAAAGAVAAGGRTPAGARAESAHDAWLAALCAPGARVEWEAASIRQLAGDVGAWREPIAVSQRSPFRLCLRLEEPDPEPTAGGDPGTGEGETGTAPGEEWFLRYLLQSRDDPSLLLGVEEVWSDRIRAIPGAQAAGVREFLLASLGQAAEISAPILASLEERHPAGCRLDSAAAHRLLRVEAAALEQAGFGVMLPAWWTRRGTAVRLNARARVRSPAAAAPDGFLLDAMTRFDWELALGSEVLSFRELEALARIKSPLVQMRGRWVEVRPEEIRAAIDFWASQEGGTMPLRDVVQTALGSRELPGDVEFGGVDADGYVGELLERLQGAAEYEQIPPPAGLAGTLRPYQLRGYSWLAFLRRWGMGACLADDMGLGKTIQSLALIARDRELGANRPVLLICPTSVLNNWRKEASRFTPDLPVLIHHGPGRSRARSFATEAGQHALVVSSYALAARDVDALEHVRWGGVVLDEAQNIKNPETQQARAVRRLRADYRIALTGTPVENHVGELWSIMEFLNPGLLGTAGEFRRRYVVPIHAGRDAAASDQLRRLTAPFILRRLKTDRAIISDLPEKLETTVYCSLTREQASLYASVLAEAQREIGGAEGVRRRGMVLATLSKLKQICNHPAQFMADNSALAGRSGKLQRLTEMLEEVLAADGRALVFTQFVEMGAIIQRHLQDTLGRETLFLHGGLRPRQRDRMVERFQEGGAGPPLFVLSLRAGGTGLNLTAANHVFHYDRWWNPAVENQATDRAFRIGQSRAVQVHRFICSGTLEERIDEMIESKRKVADLVVGSGEAWLTELSDQELREVLALGAEAVGD